MTREQIKTAERIRNNTYEDWVKSMFSTWTRKVEALIEFNTSQNALIADLELTMAWRPITDEAKKGQVLLNVGLPWPVVGIYNADSNDWAYAELQAEATKDGYFNYYHTEHEKQPKGWLPMPALSQL